MSIVKVIMNISSKMFVCNAYTFYNKLIYQLNLNSRVFEFQSVTICKKKCNINEHINFNLFNKNHLQFVIIRIQKHIGQNKLSKVW